MVARYTLNMVKSERFAFRCSFLGTENATFLCDHSNEVNPVHPNPR